MTPILAARLDAAQRAEAKGDWDSAICAYASALEEAPSLAEAHFNRANLLRRTGRIAEAAAAYDRAIALKPGWAPPHLNRGAMLADTGKPGAALQNLRRATQIAPQESQGWVNLGNALSALGRHQEAVAALRCATARAPDCALAQYNLGNALHAAGDRGGAIAAYIGALQRDAEHAPAAVNLALRLREIGELDGALRAAQLAVLAAPRLPQAQQVLGCVLYNGGDFAAAAAALENAIALDHTVVEAHANLGLVRAALGDFEGAQKSYAAALRLRPDDAQSLFGQATAWLAVADYAQGWRGFASRARMPEAEKPRFRQRRWRGERAEGARILLTAEQGFGDTLQFLRFAPLVARQAGARVILEVPKPLARLCLGLPHIDDIISRGGRLPRFDIQCSLLDLGEIFAPSLDALAPAAAYLRADPALIAARPLPAGEGKRVGLVWAGQSRPDQPHAFAMDRRRSMPLTDLLVLRRPGWRLISLQMGAPADACAEVAEIENPMAGVRDFADTAALVAQLDLVIAVDTAVAHLAAAMGKPVWLLTRFDACWRWLRGREDSPWYPSLRVFRQDTPGDWASAMAKVVAAAGVF